MGSGTEAVRVLDEHQCWVLLSGVALGRLVVVIDGHAEIFPVNFVAQEGSILLRTAEGTKLFGTAVNDEVVFEADDHSTVGGWSVVVRGTAHRLTSAAEIEKADRAGLRPWIPTVKLHYVRIEPSNVSGRRFVFGPEPDGPVPG